MPPQKLRIAIDARLRDAAATGVASYGRAVAAGLAAADCAASLLEDDSAASWGARDGFTGRWRRRMRAFWPSAVTLREGGGRLHARDIYRLAYVRFTLTGRLLRLRVPGTPGVMHWTYPIPAVIDGWHNVYTVHDVAPLRAPELAGIAAQALRRRLDAVARVADRIVAVSAWARDTIVSELGLPPARVTDCGGAVCDLTPGGVLPAGLTPGGYLLFCGLDEPRKNLARIVAGWVDVGRPLPLVLAGAGHERFAPAGAIVLPYQPREVLMTLLRDARALTFPTLEEGFGLPIAEAMALGTPVLTSCGGATAEVAGGAALLVDALDRGAIGAAVARLARDDALCAGLSAAGRARADAFTPARFGARLAALYADVAAPGHHA